MTAPSNFKHLCLSADTQLFHNREFLEVLDTDDPLIQSMNPSLVGDLGFLMVCFKNLFFVWGIIIQGPSLEIINNCLIRDYDEFEADFFDGQRESVFDASPPVPHHDKLTEFHIKRILGRVQHVPREIALVLICGA